MCFFIETRCLHIAGAAHIPPEAWMVAPQRDDWGNWLVNSKENEHPVEQAALAHHRLVTIHPFIDGNGRTARLVMNLILRQAAYPPTVILRANRKQYHRVLAEAD